MLFGYKVDIEWEVETHPSESLERSMLAFTSTER